MKTTIITLFFLSFGNFVFADFNSFWDQKEKEVTDKALAQIEQDMQSLEGIATQANAAIGAIIQKTVQTLKLKGSWRLAREIEQGWKEFDGTIIQIAQSQQRKLSVRNIGDFAPFNQWLSDVYEKTETDLGYAYCLSSRISDLKTINHGLVVVFNPCQYGYDEFYKHFASNDPKYRSFLPVVSYWATVLGCYAGSYGTGVFMICGEVGVLVEELVQQDFAPMIAPQIYGGACSP